jgi:hypothetical protein
MTTATTQNTGTIHTIYKGMHYWTDEERREVERENFEYHLKDYLPEEDSEGNPIEHPKDPDGRTIIPMDMVIGCGNCRKTLGEKLQEYIWKEDANNLNDGRDNIDVRPGMWVHYLEIRSKRDRGQSGDTTEIMNLREIMDNADTNAWVYCEGDTRDVYRENAYNGEKTLFRRFDAAHAGMMWNDFLSELNDLGDTDWWDAIDSLTLPIGDTLNRIYGWWEHQEEKADHAND